MQSKLLPVLILLSFVGFISAFTIRDGSASPRAIQIAHPNNHEFEFELDDLKTILEADNIKDRHVVIVSVAGAFRKGKSFLLNFFLRYLYAQYDRHDVSDWISDGNSTELRGFLWRGGRTPTTTGIVMWSDIFTHDYDNGDKVAIILLDTQGTFDSRSTLLESTTIFALSTLLSSVQCYNVMQNIQEDDLQNLQLFVEYARLAMEQSDEKPFQNLLFIVRDWPNQFEVDYGWNGQQVIDEVLAEHPTYQTVEMRDLRRQIRSSFANISAFLMPHPGRSVATGQFTGNMTQMDSDFKVYLQLLVESLFAPEHLLVKEINGQRVRAKELIQYIVEYTKLFNGKTLPEPKTVLQATAEINNMILFNNSLYLYVNAMGQHFKNDAKDSHYKRTEMEKFHLDARKIAIEQFQSKRKLGGSELISSFERRLSEEIDSKFEDFQAKNERILLTLMEDAKSHNEKCVNDIDLIYRQKMVERIGGFSNYHFSMILSEAKESALREFDELKRGDDLGDDQFSDSFRERLVRKLDTFQPTLMRMNEIERERNENARRIQRENDEIARRQREQNERYKTVGKTGGSALAGAGVGAMIGGPPGAALGFFLGGLFGYNFI